MSKIDLLLLGVWLFLVIYAYWSGIVRSLIRSISVFLATLVTFFCANGLNHLMGRLFPSASDYIPPVISFVLLFLSLFIFWVIGSSLHKIDEDNNYNLINRLIAAILGFVQGSIFVWVCLSLFSSFPEKGTFAEIREASHLYHSYQDRNLGAAWRNHNNPVPKDTTATPGALNP